MSEIVPSAYSWPKFRVDFRAHAAIVGYVGAVIPLLAWLSTEVYPRTTASYLPALVQNLWLKNLLVVIVLVCLICGPLWSFLKGIVVCAIGKLRFYSILHSHTVELRHNHEATSLAYSDFKREIISLWLAGQIAEDINEKVRRGDENSGRYKAMFFAFRQQLLKSVAERMESEMFPVTRESTKDNRILIAIKDAHQRLEVDNFVVVVDTDEWFQMGMFRVVQIDEGECLAESLNVQNETSSIWLGKLKEEGDKTIVIRKSALLVREDGEKNE